MRINDRVFDGANRYYRNNEALRPVAGPIYWFTEFQPVNFRCLSFIFVLQEIFFDLDICCHSGGDFPTYIAGFQTSFNSASIFFALKEHPVLKLIFQIGANPVSIFYVGPFCFTFLHDVDDLDVCQYHVKWGDETMIVTCRHRLGHL
jgi:hypothetical protein